MNDDCKALNLLVGWRQNAQRFYIVRQQLLLILLEPLILTLSTANVAATGPQTLYKQLWIVAFTRYALWRAYNAADKHCKMLCVNVNSRKFLTTGNVKHQFGLFELKNP